MQATAVRREVTVEAAPERAFAVFADEIDRWWPREYSIGEEPLARIVIEPTRWLEVGERGGECVWGGVLAYEPGRRLLLEWGIGGDWQLDSARSEIEVTFTAADGGTPSPSSTAVWSGTPPPTPLGRASTAMAGGTRCWRPTRPRSEGPAPRC